MRSGETLTAAGHPEYKAKANIYVYENINGQRTAIQKMMWKKLLKIWIRFKT